MRNKDHRKRQQGLRQKAVEKRAVGLSYRENPMRQTAQSKAYDRKAAPRVVAKGFNEVAEEIIALAKEHQVLVHEDPELADFLARLEVGDEIPEALYIVVAELIAFATWLDLKA